MAKQRILKNLLVLGINILQLLCLLPNAHSQVINLDSLQVDSSVVDTSITSKLKILSDKFQQYNPLYLNNINTALLDTEIKTINGSFDNKSLSLDSFYNEQALDTLLRYQEQINTSLSRLKTLQQTITGYQSNLQSLREKITLLKTDPILINKQSTEDSTSINNNKNEALKIQIQTTDLRIKHKLDSLRQLITLAEYALQKGVNVRNDVSEKINTVTTLNKNQESKYIWSAPKKITGKNLISSFKANNESRRTVSRVFSSNWSALFLLVLLSIGFSYWIYRNYRYLYGKNKKGNKSLIEGKNLKIGAQGILFLLTFFPFFMPQVSTLVIQVVVLITVLTFTFLMVLKGKFAKKEIRWWLGLTILYVFILLINNFLNNGFFIRIIALLLNLIAFFFCYSLRSYFRRNNSRIKIKKVVFLLFIIFNLLAIGMNVYGKVVYSKSLSISSIVGLVQYICLIGFIQVIKDAFSLQFEVSEKAGGFFKSVTKLKAQITLKKVLNFIALILWFTVLFINLGLIRYVLNGLNIFISEPHSVGGISFTWGNIFLFILIIAISNWFQKHLPLFFSDSSNKAYSTVPETQGSKIALLRLIIVIGGCLFGVGALGISMDKLTIILGALSVGIGLGLQNIFNNFVSGVILIFDKPFRIGDFVELADKKGRVQDIGIRSSTLITQEGAEIIIPNGDFLSGRLVNWTLSKSYSKSGITIKVSSNSDIDRIIKLVEEEACGIEYTKKDVPIEILYSNITPDSVDLRVNCWIDNIYNEQLFKSKLLQVLFARFKREEIEITNIE